MRRGPDRFLVGLAWAFVVMAVLICVSELVSGVGEPVGPGASLLMAFGARWAAEDGGRI